MLKWLTQRTDHRGVASVIYGSIVASARQQHFYATWQVPDTREGRFEMVAMHVALVMRRLERAGAAGTELARALAETFMTDMDDNMREIGIGDLAVPKKVKRAAAALYDRHRDYAAALVLDDAAASDNAAASSALATAVASALSGEARQSATIPGLDCGALAHYMQRLHRALGATSDADCLAGKLPLPWPPI